MQDEKAQKLPHAIELGESFTVYQERLIKEPEKYGRLLADKEAADKMQGAEARELAQRQQKEQLKERVLKAEKAEKLAKKETQRVS